MAQRTGCGIVTANSDMRTSFFAAVGSCEAEKRQTIPARTGHLGGNGAQRAVMTALVVEPVCQHRHGNSLATILALQQCARPWDTPIKAGARTGADCRSSFHGKELGRRQQSDIGLVR